MEGASIPEILSLAAASKELRQHKRYVKGVADGLGVELRAVGTALVMSRDDFERIRVRIEARHPAHARPAVATR